MFSDEDQGRRDAEVGVPRGTTPCRRSTAHGHPDLAVAQRGRFPVAVNSSPLCVNVCIHLQRERQCRSLPFIGRLFAQPLKAV